MKLINTPQIRKTALCVITAIAVAAPGLTSAALGDRARDRLQTVKTNASVLITNVRERQPLANVIDTVKSPATEIFDSVRELQVMEQLQQTMALMRQMQSEYDYFSGGEGCGATCANFRSSLKNVFNSFLTLIYEVPALSGDSGLVENIQRMSNLIDYLPARALYLMWQTMSAKMAELEASAEEIRQTLNSLPPLLDPTSFGPNTMSVSTSTSGANNSGFCAWADQEDKPVLDLIQARLEFWGWKLEKVEGLIPDIEVKAEGGGEAGAAVANVTAAAGVGMKPTDSLKIALKVLSYIPQRINWAIKLNVLRAKVVCAAV